ncbi:MAG: hypothetical protein EXS08_02265 [Planctomycetes bacterium]|nr:hypothetical protein [Planctomycetota bacterium]
MRTRILLFLLLAPCAVLSVLWLSLCVEARSAPGESAPVASAPDAVAPFELAPAEPPTTGSASSRSPQAPERRPRSEAPRRKRADEPAPPRRWLTATFLRADLTPVREAKVEAQAFQVGSATRVEQKLALDAEGRLRLDLQEEWSGVRLSLEVAEHGRFERFVELPPTSGPLELGVVVLAAGGTLEGLVRGLESQRDWTLSILPRGAQLPSFVPRGTTGFTRLDLNGRFRFEHVPPGKVELCLFHPQLGSALEQEFEVREGATTPVELSYSGHDPSRALLVQVGIGRAPLASELWLTDARGHSLAPSSIREVEAWFNELDEDAYTLTLAVAGHEPVLKRDVRPGTRVKIGFPPATPTFEREHLSREQWNGLALEARSGDGSGTIELQLEAGQSVRVQVQEAADER